jgi:uncharacterized protein
MEGMLQLLRLINSLGKVEGRKKLQKIVHILKSCGHEFPQHFGYLHYGPFSSEVAAEIDSLVSGSLVREQRVAKPYETYVYESGDSARQLLGDLKQAGTPVWHDLASHLNGKPVSELEALSTVLYLRANGFAGDKLKTRFAELKPSLKRLYDKALAESQKLPKLSLGRQ